MRKYLDKIFTVLVFVVLYAPLLVMVLFSFNEGKSTSVFSGFSLRWYGELFASSGTITALRNTLVLAVASAVIATILGTLAAIGIYFLRNRFVRSSVMMVTNIPMMNPDIVTGVSLMLLFVFAGRMLGSSNSLSFWTLLIAHVTFNLPYVILNVLPKLNQADPRLQEAAQDLGSTPARAFVDVVLPFITPGVVSGFLMAFTLSLDDFVISYYTTGADYQTLPLKIFAMTKKTVKPDMYALSTLIFLTVLVLLLAINVVQMRPADSKKNPGAAKRRRVLKRGVAAALCLLVVFAGAAIFLGGGVVQNDEDTIPVVGTYSDEYAGTTLNVFNWGEYISDGSDDSLDVNAEFEKLTGIKVNYLNYESNEAMYAKLKSGAVSYDIIIPSDYMVQRLISENMVQELDFSKLDNYRFISDEYKSLYFDPEDIYSVPYSVGMVGLIYNTTMVEEAPTSWSVMWDERYADNILTFNNSRDAFAIAQMLLGLDLNSTNTADWDAAAAKLMEQNDVLQGRVMDEVFNKMEGGNAAIAPYYAGDFYTMAKHNEDLAFVYPEEGVNIFVDSVCVPSNAQNYEAAMMYINFLMEPEVALANAEYICYASPNTAVVENDNYSFKGDEVLYPSAENKPKTQYFHDLDPAIRTYYEKLWEAIVKN
ncbi:MAG: extracellular solute-binding protein [Clostridia bacterium]|nr:extracellular solute-binding protein [Clostridia bacterium]